MKFSPRKICVFAAAVLFAVAAAVALSMSSPRDLLVDDTKFSEEIREAALRHGVPPQLVRAVIFQESRFDPRARGAKGEIGLMQLLPAGAVAEWARVCRKNKPGEDQLFDVSLNLEIGCWYLGRALRRWKDYDGAVELALAQYNAGLGRVKRWNISKKDRVLPLIKLRSTKRYVELITRRYRSYIR